MSVRVSVSGFGAASLAARVDAAPFVEPGDAVTVDEWLAAHSAAADRLRPAMAANPVLERLLAGLGHRSPYLWGLGSADPERLIRILAADPDKYLDALLEQADAAIPAASSEAEAMRLLRDLKAEAALLIALADIGGVWSVMQVTAALTGLADCTVRTALRYLLNDAGRRGTLRSPNPGEPEAGSGYFALAMGKMGAGELNYSSDIDLIVLFDPDAPALPADVELAAFHIRLTRGLVKLLQERTADGYVFRVDLRLRPDPASTQIAISTVSALDYYEHRGQNWERSAMIKARVCAGDAVAGEAFLKALTPFVWRKYMDFAAVADIHAMKRQIHAYKGHGEIAVEGFNVKLGRGGIREIEFFVQTQQLIAGGRHPELRDRRTLATLAALVEGGWIEADARDDLERAYLFLRTVEHRLQMVADEQTHSLPADAERMQGFARFCGYADRDAFADALVGHLRKVQVHYSRLFELAEVATDERLVFRPDADDRGTLDRLTELGFRNPLEVSATLRGWLAGRMPALRSEFAREQLQGFIPQLLTHLSRAENRDTVLVAFERFLTGLHPGGAGRLFSLLRQNPGLLALFMLILSDAPRLADILAGHPQVIDGLIDPAFFGAVPDADTLRDALHSSLAQATSYEDFLDRLRLFGQEHMFLIGARILSGTLSAELAGQAFARLADVIIRALHREVEEKFAQAHGRIRDQKTALLAMGKLGGREMTATSDLDLILVYDFDEAHPESDGPRPLYGAQYFARLTQRLISALTARTNYGALYEVDMRLRPSGRSGPVATQLASFRHYQEHDAWTWEHMALTRARVVSATPGFEAAVQEVIGSVLRRPRNRELIAGDALEMRNAIAQEKRDDDRWDLKYAAGGLIDIEFLAQYLQLVYAAGHPALLDTSTARTLEKATRIGLLAADDSEVLRSATQLYQDLSQILRLCIAGRFEPDKAGVGLQELLARAADVPNFATLDAYLADLEPRVRRSFLRILGAPAVVD
ncbi:MAG: bifunctional [glutamine synthetase] adenylyltransferase/[glutamine synthetase]-adenylyl-L-tyrosine phosphorylase [Pseudorhodoplanes sp.]|nr:bifunctional [glutamine synthetase] adenylyltransferase/[glutamine synthetase]-adenylyl-L-tyrosine phosphorylase [Pseudorhodoplanes sp.]